MRLRAECTLQMCELTLVMAYAVSLATFISRSKSLGGVLVQAMHMYI